MTEDINFDGITRNAQGWSDYFARNKIDPDVERDKVSMAFGKIKTTAYDIIKDELEYAIENSTRKGESEFSREPLKQPLLDAFLSEEMLRVTADGYVYLNTSIAGDDADLWDGINAAREILKANNKSERELSPAQKSAFWRRVVFPSYGGGGSDEDGDLWSSTIALRFQGWQGLAPYWYFLEHGNTSGGNGGTPFPENDATNFVMKIEKELNKMMQLALLEVDSLESNVIENEMNEFLRDPENHVVYDILEEFYQNGRKYYVYITPTRQIGVALQTSYRRMYGR